MIDNLKLARSARERIVLRTREVLEACACEYPLRRLRNWHGHADGCPAIEIWKRHRDEDDAARALCSR